MGYLDQGNLRYSRNFRGVYANIVTDWLGNGERLVLGTGTERLAGCLS